MTPCDPEFLLPLLAGWRAFDRACATMNAEKTPASRDAVQARGMAFHHVWLQHRTELESWLGTEFGPAARGCWWVDPRGKLPPEIMKRPAMMFVAAQRPFVRGYAHHAERDTHTVWLVSAQGGVHTTAWPTLGWEPGEQWFGGVECHSGSAPAFSPTDAPSHSSCWLLCAPCWHDGTSLGFTECVTPHLPAPNGQPWPPEVLGPVFYVLCSFHRGWFKPE